MTNYTRGRQLEYRVKRDLERVGYFVVRSAGSKGAADLIALSPNHAPLLVQCKVGRIDKREADALAVIARMYRAVAVSAVRVGRSLTYRQHTVGDSQPIELGEDACIHTV